MRAFAMTELKTGINRLRTKGGASPKSLYDLVNGYVTQQKTLASRPGTISTANLPAGTKGLFGYKGALHVFGNALMSMPTGYVLDLIRFPFFAGFMNSSGALTQIHYVAPFFGKLYVVAEFDGGIVRHFWLDDPGAWKANTKYAQGGRVRPTADNQLAYEIVAPAPPATWQPSTSYTMGSSVQPTTPDGFKYTVTFQNPPVVQKVAIVFKTEPVWNATEGAVTTQAASGPEWQAASPVSQNYSIAPASVQNFYYYVSTPGVTGTTEPVWPLTAGATVVDGTAVWTAGVKPVLQWTASAIWKSGAVEPTWPTSHGQQVVDGTITWEVRFKDILDPNCPHNKATIVAAGKVFSIDDDVTRYCATNNARDWTTADNAGFLPTGLQAQGSQSGTALGSYRGNLVWWSDSTAQIWNVDPDPAQMSLFDVLESAGLKYSKAHAAVDNDLYWLSPLGVRSISVAVGSTNLQAGDLGSGIDSLVTADIAAAGPTLDPLGFYFPAQGQFWLSLSMQSFVYTRSIDGQVGAWSRYVFPWSIDHAAQLGGELYLRSGDTVRRVDKALGTDDGVPFGSVAWWPHLDFGNMGVTKHLIGLDLVATGSPTVQFGYDQNDFNVLTDPYAIDPDTLTGGLIPFPLSAPSISMRLNFTGGWSVNASALYLSDRRLSS